MKTLFSDDFSGYEVAEVIRVPLEKPGPHLGAWRQSTLHYIWRSPRFGSWMETAFPWMIGEEKGRRYIELPDVLMNAVLTAGEERWRNYEVGAELAWTGQGTIGVMFRYQTSRHNYRLDFVEGRLLRIVRRNDEKEVTLAEQEFPIQTGRWYAVRVVLEDSRIRGFVDEKLAFDLEDAMYAFGSIGLRWRGRADVRT